MRGWEGGEKGPEGPRGEGEMECEERRSNSYTSISQINTQHVCQILLTVSV